MPADIIPRIRGGAWPMMRRDVLGLVAVAANA
jgi:hypothetical protein